MKPSRYIWLHLGLTLLLIATGLVALAVEPAKQNTLLIEGAILLNSITSYVGYRISWYGLEKMPRFFMNYVLMGMFIKMMAGLATIMLLAWLLKEGVIPYAGAFMLSYLIFTALEVIYLMKKARTGPSTN